MTTNTLTFADLGLPQTILDAVTEMGFTNPSPIQQACIPHLLEGRDVLGMAQTGSGKTAAFSLPTLAKIDADQRHPQHPIKSLLMAVHPRLTQCLNRVAGQREKPRVPMKNCV